MSARRAPRRNPVSRPDAPAQCRVREAVIAVLLAHPAYAETIPAALAGLSASEQLALRFFYSASMLLQRQYVALLRPYVAEQWQWLPDLYSQELGVATQGTPQERLGDRRRASCEHPIRDQLDRHL